MGKETGRYLYAYYNGTNIVLDEDVKMFKGQRMTIVFEPLRTRRKEIDIAEKAAQIRAQYKHFKGMDAIQLAAACITGCDLFLTNDKQLKQFMEIRVVTIDDFQLK